MKKTKPAANINCIPIGKYPEAELEALASVSN
jgi:hypothetical protein